jgi:undecaprenyl-diphosphatase
VDARLFRWFNHLADRTPWAHGAATTFATWGIGLLGLALVGAWIDARGADDPTIATAAVGWAGAAALVGALAVQLVGSAIDRARPTTVLHGTHLLLERTADFSFPSDHVTACATVATGLVLAGPHLRHRWYGWAAWAATFLMALARVYVGAHYPGDVLAGAVLGSAVAIAFGPWAVPLLARLSAWAASTPLRPLVAVKTVEPVV